MYSSNSNSLSLVHYVEFPITCGRLPRRYTLRSSCVAFEPALYYPSHTILVYLQYQCVFLQLKRNTHCDSYSVAHNMYHVVFIVFQQQWKLYFINNIRFSRLIIKEIHISIALFYTLEMVVLIQCVVRTLKKLPTLAKAVNTTVQQRGWGTLSPAWTTRRWRGCSLLPWGVTCLKATWSRAFANL